ncbi:MAG: glycosyltransferase [bacterium]
MNNYKTILYLTAVEDAVNKPVIRSQVFGLLSRFMKATDINFFFLAFIPFRFYFDLNRPFNTFLAYKKKRMEIKHEFKASNIKIIFFPFLFPFRRKYFHMKSLHLFVFLIQTIPLLLFFLIKENILLIHARSYPACLISYLCSKVLNVKYLFEMRGFFPDEGVIYGAYTYDSSSYFRWKNIEKNLIKGAHSVIVESEPFKKYVENIFHHPNIALIPCYVDNDIFKFNKDLKDKMKNDFNLNGKVVVTYSGTIGGWHDPVVQTDYFLKTKQLIPNAHFLILTFKQNNKLIHDIMKEKGLAKSEYTLLNPKLTDIPKYLLLGDVGLLTIHNLPTAKKAVSVKFGEYLACGLPVVCTPYVEGAANLIQKNDCGIIVNLDKEETFEQIYYLLKNYDKIQQNGFKLVRDYLSIKINAQKFLQIYDKIIA